MTKIALVTGSSRGIGKAIALELAKLKYSIIVNYNSNEEEANKTVEEVKQLGADAIAVKGNMSDGESITAMVAAAIEKYGKIDVLVNNAGITKDRTLKKMSDDEWNAVINTNLTGVFKVTRAVLPHMGEGGRIINISSVVAHYGNFGQTNYAATKAGLLGLTKSLAKEVGPKKITVNAVCPGFVKTDMTKDLGFIKEKIINYMTPLKDFADPEDIAYAVSFLASEKAKFITGTVINVDGGLAF